MTGVYYSQPARISIQRSRVLERNFNGAETEPKAGRHPLELPALERATEPMRGSRHPGCLELRPKLRPVANEREEARCRVTGVHAQIKQRLGEETLRDRRDRFGTKHLPRRAAPLLGFVGASKLFHTLEVLKETIRRIIEVERLRHPTQERGRLPGERGTPAERLTSTIRRRLEHRGARNMPLNEPSNALKNGGIQESTSSAEWPRRRTS